MKHPVLSIKKGFRVYDDTQADDALLNAARDAAQEREEERKKRRPRPRRSRLTFLPLLVVGVALGAVFITVSGGPTDRATVAGWQAVLRATPYGESLILSVTFIRIAAPSGSSPADAAPRATVLFELPETGQALTLSGPLERSPITLRGQLPSTRDVRRVQADVSVENGHARLTRAVPVGP